MAWNAKYWDILSNLYWTPRYLGLKSISRDQWRIEGQQIFIPRELVKNVSGPLYFRNQKLDELKLHLHGQEEILNHLFNLTFAIAGDAVISKLLFEPLGFSDAGPFESLGREVGERYGWGSNATVTQQDGMFVSSRSIVGVELKLGSKSWAEQIAKYIALLVWEMELSGPRDQLGLLFIVPEQAMPTHWEAVGLSGPRIDADFFERLDAGRLPKKVRSLFREKPAAVGAVAKQLHMVVLSWAQFRDRLRHCEGDLDHRRVGDQTLIRLLRGLRVQIEQHEKTGIPSELVSSDGTDSHLHQRILEKADSRTIDAIGRDQAHRSGLTDDELGELFGPSEAADGRGGGGR